MKIALFWPCGQIGRAVLQKLIAGGDYVYLYTDDADGCKADCTACEVVCGRMDDPEAMQRAVRAADAVVCCVDAVLGRRKDRTTPHSDGLSAVFAAMRACGKSRIFIAAPACGEGPSERSGMLRVFGRLFHSFAPHMYRDADALLEAVRGSGLRYTVIRYLNPFLKHSRGGYVLAEEGERSRRASLRKTWPPVWPTSSIQTDMRAACRSFIIAGRTEQPPSACRRL